MLAGRPLVNPNPTLRSADDEEDVVPLADPRLDSMREDMFEIIRTIQDPEHPYTLGDLKVVQEGGIQLTEHTHGNSTREHVFVEFVPTVPHCSLATMIGLCIRTKLMKFYPTIKLDIKIKAGTHQTKDEIDKQVNDKERVQSALENPPLREMVHRLIKEPHSHD